jgi:hypothetical protein
MSKIHKLLAQISAQEEQLRSAEFFAPCVQGGQIKTRVAGMIYQFIIEPRDFAGWGIFQAENERVARLLDTAKIWQFSEYLEYFPAFTLRLAYPLQGKTWLAYPVNESDISQRLGTVKPLAIHLVEDGETFAQIIARFDGQSWWFQELDRRADLELEEYLKSALKTLVRVQKLATKGLTREVKTLYNLVTQKTKGFSMQADENLLAEALEIGGGALQGFRDKGNYWTVQWFTADGTLHSSAIAKKDLTVISSGICLSGRDRDFDLQSLVGVIEHR